MTEKEEKITTAREHRSDAQAPVEQGPASPSRCTPHSHLPPVSVLGMTPHGVGHPSGQLGSAVLAGSPLTSCPPISSLAGEHKNLNSPCSSISTAQKQLKQWVINIIVTLNPKFSAIPASRNKMNSIPTKTRRTSWYLLCRYNLPCTCWPPRHDWNILDIFWHARLTFTCASCNKERNLHPW